MTQRQTEGDLAEWTMRPDCQITLDIQPATDRIDLDYVPLHQVVKQSIASVGNEFLAAIEARVNAASNCGIMYS